MLPLLPQAQADDYTAWQSPHPEWELVFSDEFDSATLDSSKWSRFTYNNSNADWYKYQSRDPELVQMNDDGTVTLWGKYGDYTSQSDKTGANDTYACGGFTSNGKFAFQYGYVEVRARFDTVQGCWPAIWMMPTYNGSLGWPQNGEIDIMEHLNADTKAYQTLHSMRENANSDYSRGVQPALSAPTGWHTYGVLWQEGSITMLVDGNVAGTFSTDNIRWPFDSPNNEFYFNIDQQIGGSWVEGRGSGGIDQNTLATTGAAFDIDYVRVYSYADGRMNLTKGDTTDWSGTGLKSSLDDLVVNITSAGSTGAAHLHVDDNVYVQDLRVSGGDMEVDIDDGHTLRAREIRLSNGCNIAIDGQTTLEKLTGTGKISITSNGTGLTTLTASESSFTGTLEINLGTQHVLLKNNATISGIAATEGTIKGSRQFFLPSGGKYANLVVNGTGSGKQLVVDNQYIHDYSLHIGTLSGNASAIISGQNGPNYDKAYRYITIHQNADTTFQGKFIDSGKSETDFNRSVGIIKYGTGNLVLTGQNTSTANLETNEGILTLDGARWAGAVWVNAGALAINGTVTTGANVTIATGATLNFLGTGDTVLKAGNWLTFQNGTTLNLSGLDLRGLAGGTDVTLATSSQIRLLGSLQTIAPGLLDENVGWKLATQNNNLIVSLLHQTLDVTGGSTYTWSSLKADTTRLELNSAEASGSPTTVDIDPSITISDLNIKGDGTVNISTTGSNTFNAGAINIEDGATLSVAGKVTLNELSGSGKVTIDTEANTICLNASDSSFSGCLEAKLGSGKKHFVIANGEDPNQQGFVDSGNGYVKVDIQGKNSGEGEFVIDNNFTHDNALNIGDLSGNAHAIITGRSVGKTPPPPTGRSTMASLPSRAAHGPAMSWSTMAAPWPQRARAIPQGKR